MNISPTHVAKQIFSVCDGWIAKDTHTHKKGNCTVIFSFFFCGVEDVVCYWKNAGHFKSWTFFSHVLLPFFVPYFYNHFSSPFFIISRLFSGHLYIRDTTHKRSLRRYNRLRVELASSRVSYMGGARHRQNNCGWKKKEKLLAFIHSGHRRTQQVYQPVGFCRVGFVI